MIAEPEYEEKLKKLPLYDPQPGDGNLVLIDMIRIVREVRKLFPDMQIEHFGEPHTLVEVVSPEKKPNIAVIITVWFLLFIGSGMAIMNFHADVSMLEVHRRIYELITGERVAHPLILQIPYSIGIGAGMILFFNHLFKKKINEEPSPLEVEMYMYQESIHQYVITDEYSKIHAKEEERV